MRFNDLFFLEKQILTGILFNQLAAQFPTTRSQPLTKFSLTTQCQQTVTTSWLRIAALTLSSW